MDPSLATSPTTSNGGISVQNSKLNIFFWNFFKTLTILSMLFMVLSIYYSFFASKDESRVVLYAIIMAFAILSYTFIIPNLAEIAAAAIPFVGVNRFMSIRCLKLGVWMIGKYKYPFLIYFQSSSLMTGVGLLKLYGDGGPGCIRVMDVIAFDAMYHCMYTFGYHKEIHGTGYTEYCGTGWAMFGLSIMGLIAYCLPPLMEPGREY